jgi:phage terminase large subunit GpA-like protein
LIPGRQNHVLDARIYARAAAALAGLDRFTDSDWDSRERMLTPAPAAPAATPADDPPPSTSRRRRRAAALGFRQRARAG